MYKKATAVELQFSPDRLNDGAGDPFWIDLNHNEAVELHQALQRYLDTTAAERPAPFVVSIDHDDNADAPESTGSNGAAQTQTSSDDFKQWVCVICGWVYDEAAGLPDEGLAPGTRWADVPDDWRCPLCDVGKEDFALVEF
ncbi:rubredoxin [Paraburkholderia sabiae]|uniref:Rubredoxin n=1 Tax=Paraburkholderia sabiae TaxID=273251 RepID=A0ABU9Q8J4_9BURK|nr:rubredoxin [Paraburkholderia sabiae]WJZ78304.1 rubredoxin [Paraburkholderia sabiae]CAD6507042.1 Anaerobic nitric oxide reductase flavorubredoxin [Paraburkholderia sabiae]